MQIRITNKLIRFPAVHEMGPGRWWRLAVTGRCASGVAAAGGNWVERLWCRPVRANKRRRSDLTAYSSVGRPGRLRGSARLTRGSVRRNVRIQNELDDC